MKHEKVSLNWRSRVEYVLVLSALGIVIGAAAYWLLNRVLTHPEYFLI